MATTLTVIGLPVRITLGDADDVTRVDMPEFANGLLVQFIANAGKLAVTGTDGEAIGAAYETIAAATPVARPRFGRRAFYLASADAGTVVEVTPYSGIGPRLLTGTLTFASAPTIAIDSAVTNAAVLAQTIGATSTGTIAGGFAVRQRFVSEDAGGTARNVADIEAAITTATAGSAFRTAVTMAVMTQDDATTPTQRFRLSAAGLKVGVIAGQGASATMHVQGLSAQNGNFRPTLRCIAPTEAAAAASTEINAVDLDLSATVEFATGALATQRAIRVKAPTYAFVAASTLSDAVTLDIDNAPQAGANATITRGHALRVQAGRSSLLGDAVVAGSGRSLGFFGATPAAKQVVPLGSTTDDLLAALHTIGLLAAA